MYLFKEKIPVTALLLIVVPACISVLIYITGVSNAFGYDYPGTHYFQFTFGGVLIGAHCIVGILAILLGLYMKHLEKRGDSPSPITYTGGNEADPIDLEEIKKG